MPVVAGLVEVAGGVVDTHKVVMGVGRAKALIWG